MKITLICSVIKYNTYILCIDINMEIDQNTNGFTHLSVHIKLENDNYIRIFKRKSEEDRNAIFRDHAI